MDHGWVRTALVITFIIAPEASLETSRLMTAAGWLCVYLQYASTRLEMVAAALVGLRHRS